MELTINKNSLVDALTLAMPYTTTKSPVEILKYGKCTIKGNRIKIESNDSQGGIVRYLPLDNSCESGCFLLNVAEVYKYVRSLKDASISISFNEETLIIKHSKGSAEFKVPSAADYPQFGQDKDGMVDIEIPSSFLSDAIKYCKNFVSTNTLHPVLTAIYVYTAKGKIGFCGTDTSVLVHKEYDMPSMQTEEKSFFIMPNVFASITEICKNGDLCKVSFNNKYISYRIGDSIITSTMVLGKFPQFQRIIPTSHQIECVIDKKEFIDTISRVSLFCDDTSCVKLELSSTELLVSADNMMHAKKSLESVKLDRCDADVAIGVNFKNIVKGCYVFQGEKIRFEINDSQRPIVIKQEEDNATVLVMPMQLVN